MPKGILFVETTPSAPEREADFNDWYNDTHLVDVLKLSGFTSARRFRKLGDGGHPYAAIYEVEGDDHTSHFRPIVTDGSKRSTSRLYRNDWDPVLKHRLRNLNRGLVSDHANLLASLHPQANIHRIPRSQTKFRIKRNIEGAPFLAFFARSLP